MQYEKLGTEVASTRHAIESDVRVATASGFVGEPARFEMSSTFSTCLETGSSVNANFAKGFTSTSDAAAAASGPAGKFSVTSSSEPAPYAAYPQPPMSRLTTPTMTYVKSRTSSYSSGCSIELYIEGKTACPAKTKAIMPKVTGSAAMWAAAVVSATWAPWPTTKSYVVSPATPRELTTPASPTYASPDRSLSHSVGVKSRKDTAVNTSRAITGEPKSSSR
mmetsp:Transcript_12658/g.53222  ORF Transcript_12658/g.53222 Transcript_12658/m.53222 type:complete len:221 (+) Transcript_12658:360-1022(+)